MPEAPRHQPLQKTMPALLSFVAGYVDSYTYLALFGLFVAQVTGSFVIAGAEIVRHDAGAIGKLLAMLVFIIAAAMTAALIALARERGYAPMPWMLALEAALLAVFVAIILFGPDVNGANDWHGITAGLFAASAMGAQSVLVRLLMKGIPQTNVMTGNMTQLGIETTELWLAWRRHRRNPADREDERAFVAVRTRLSIVLAIAVGFIVGAVCGAIAYAKTGLPGTPLAVALVGALTVWAVWRGRRA